MNQESEKSSTPKKMPTIQKDTAPCHEKAPTLVVCIADAIAKTMGEMMLKMAIPLGTGRSGRGSLMIAYAHAKFWIINVGQGIMVVNHHISVITCVISGSRSRRYVAVARTMAPSIQVKMPAEQDASCVCATTGWIPGTLRIWSETSAEKGM